MAQDITLMGATYLAVPAVLLPTSNGTAQFTDVSDTTASASDVASGKYFYTANGTKTQGSATTPSVQTNRSYTVSGSGSATINPSSGYDAMSNVSLTVPSGTATAPSTISGTSASVSTGTNTLTLSKSVSNTPRITTAGYISSGTSGSSSVSLTASVTTKGATTYTPTTSNQTIASGTYLTGAQTIAGDADLVAGNIKKDVTIFGVTGTYEGSGGGGGSTTFDYKKFSLTQNGTCTVNFSATPVIVFGGIAAGTLYGDYLPTGRGALYFVITNFNMSSYSLTQGGYSFGNAYRDYEMITISGGYDEEYGVDNNIRYIASGSSITFKFGSQSPKPSGTSYFDIYVIGATITN